MAGSSNAARPYKIVGDKLGANPEEIEKGVNAARKLYSIAGKRLGGVVSASNEISSGFGKVLSVASPYVAAAMAIVDILGINLFGKKESEFDILYKQIRELFKALEGKVDLTSRQQMLTALAGVDANADATMQATVNYVVQAQEGTLNTANTAFAAFMDAGYESLAATKMIMKDVCWQRTLDQSDTSVIAGSERHRYWPPPLENKFIWDYTEALPVLIRTIDARITYLFAVDPDFRTNYSDEIVKLANFAQDRHDKIQAGFVLTEAPTFAAGGKIKGDDWQHGPMGGGFWYRLGQPSGAVDIYAGSAAIEEFPLPQPSLAEQAGDRRTFNLLYLARTLRMRQKLDLIAGLPELRQIIAKLRMLTGEQSTLSTPALGARDIVTPSAALRQQLEKPTMMFGYWPDKDNKEHAEQVGKQIVNGKLQFKVSWPAQARTVVDQFTAAHALDRRGSMRAMVVGEAA